MSNSVCVDRYQSRLEKLELVSLIVSVDFQMVSVLQSIEVQHQIFVTYNRKSHSYLVIREFGYLELQHPVSSIFGNRF